MPQDQRLALSRISGAGAAPGDTLVYDGYVWKPGASGGNSCVAAYSTAGAWAAPPNYTPLTFGTPIVNVGADITLSGGGLWTINTTGRYVVNLELTWSGTTSAEKGRAIARMDTSTLPAGNLFYEGNQCAALALVDGVAGGGAGPNPGASHTSVPVLLQAGDSFSFQAQIAMNAGSSLNFAGGLLVSVSRV